VDNLIFQSCQFSHWVDLRTVTYFRTGPPSCRTSSSCRCSHNSRQSRNAETCATRRGPSCLCSEQVSKSAGTKPGTDIGLARRNLSQVRPASVSAASWMCVPLVFPPSVTTESRESLALVLRGETPFRGLTYEYTARVASPSRIFVRRDALSYSYATAFGGGEDRQVQGT